MGDVTIKFDDKDVTEERSNETSVVLKARCENVVKMPTHSEEKKTGLISKIELLPGVFMAKKLTKVKGEDALLVL
jgi:hypothetical protein